MKIRTRFAAASLLLVPALFAGCGLIGDTSGVNKAQYVLPKQKRILVFVDVNPTVTVPAGFPAQLADKIVGELYKYKAIETPVGQARLSELRRDQDKFTKLGVADIARATDADLVVYVNVITFDASAISDDSMTQGNAQALVKVIDSTGKRIWPENNVSGNQVDVAAEPKFTEARDKAATAVELSGRLARDTARLFRAWTRNENGMKNE